MTLLEQIKSDIKDSMRARDADRTEALRLLADSLQKEAKAKLRDLDDAEEIKVLSRERKQRIEAAEAFEQGGAEQRAAAERFQLGLIEAYLPQQLDEAEVAKLVAEAIAEVGATEPKQMGAVMKALQPKIAGRADGKVVSQAVRDALAQ
jgi:uncharacterized protein YqeY